MDIFVALLYLAMVAGLLYMLAVSLRAQPAAPRQNVQYPFKTLAPAIQAIEGVDLTVQPIRNVETGEEFYLFYTPSGGMLITPKASRTMPEAKRPE